MPPRYAPQYCFSVYNYSVTEIPMVGYYAPGGMGIGMPRFTLQHTNSVMFALSNCPFIPGRGKVRRPRSTLWVDMLGSNAFFNLNKDACLLRKRGRRFFYSSFDARLLCCYKNKPEDACRPFPPFKRHWVPSNGLIKVHILGMACCRMHEYHGKHNPLSARGGGPTKTSGR